MKYQISKNSNTLVGVFLDETRSNKALNELLYGLSMQEKPVDVVLMHSGLPENELLEATDIAKNPVIELMTSDEDGNQISNKLESSGLNFYLLEVKQEGQNFSHAFNTVFNLASDNGYEWCSIVEQEDVISPAWFKLVDVYASEMPECKVFLPLIRNNVNGTFSGFLNEACWAEGMAEEAGKTDMSLLLRYSCIHPLSAAFNVEAIKEYSQISGGRLLPMKESFKIVNFYEFFLRMIYNDIKVATIPRVGYEMRFFHKDRFIYTSSKIPQNITALRQEDGGMSQDEAKFWLELSKKEYFFDDDRGKTYVQVQ